MKHLNYLVERVTLLGERVMGFFIKEVRKRSRENPEEIFFFRRICGWVESLL